MDFRNARVYNGEDEFWLTFGKAFPRRRSITDAGTFQDAFKVKQDLDKRWTHPVVLFFDEFDRLNSAARSSCLKAIFDIKNNQDQYVIESIILIGTFDVVTMSQEN